MIPDKYIALMNQEIDGANSPEESLELQRYLEANPQGQQCYEELRQVAQAFLKTKAVDPPGSLRELILSSVLEKDIEMAREKSKIGFLDSMAELFRLGFKRKYAYVFAAGLIIGICLFAILSRMGPQTSPADLEKLYGTITGEAGSTGFTSEVPFDFELPAIEGRARFHYSEDRIWTELSLSSAEKIEVVFEYGGNVSFDGFKALGKGEFDIEVVESSTRLGHTGEGNVIVFFKDGLGSLSPVSLKIISQGDLIFEKTISPGRE